MATYRVIRTRFWDDAYIARLSPTQKLFYLYILSSPLANVAGAYEISRRRMAFDTALSESEVAECLTQFEKDGKVIYREPWLGIIKFTRHQVANPKVLRGMAIALEAAPPEIVGELDLPNRLRLMLGDPPKRGFPEEEGRGQTRRPGGAKHISELLHQP